jgi:hypothetical protein
MSFVKDRKSAAAVGSALVISGLLVSTLVMRTSSAAFTATDIHAGNSFASGILALTDNQVDGSGIGSALFTTATAAAGTATYAGALDGGQTVVHCVTVTLNNTLQTGHTRSITLYLTGVTGGGVGTPATADLGPNLSLMVESAPLPAGTSVGPDCTVGGPVATPPTWTTLSVAGDTLTTAGGATGTTPHNTWATGYAGWTGAIGNASKVYRITNTVADIPAAQNSNAFATFTWEAR